MEIKGKSQNKKCHETKLLRDGLHFKKKKIRPVKQLRVIECCVCVCVCEREGERERERERERDHGFKVMG